MVFCMHVYCVFQLLVFKTVCVSCFQLLVFKTQTLELKASCRITTGTTNTTAIRSIEFSRRGKYVRTPYEYVRRTSTAFSYSVMQYYGVFIYEYDYMFL